MAETETAPTEGSTILTTPEPTPPNKEAQLFQSEGQKANAVAAAKEAVMKELEQKTAADKIASDKAAADAAAAEAAKKAEPEKPKPTTTEQKPPAKAGEPAPTDYTLNLPENSALTKEDLESTLKEAKDAGLSAEEAKELLETKDATAKTAQTRLLTQQQEQLKSLVSEWKETVKNDPDLGGEHLTETALKASRAFKAVASPALIEFFNKTGYGDHPEMVRMMRKVYDLIGEDKFVRGSTGMTNTGGPRTIEERAKKLFGKPIQEAAV